MAFKVQTHLLTLLPHSSHVKYFANITVITTDVDPELDPFIRIRFLARGSSNKTML